MNLAHDLAAYDGKTVAILEEIDARRKAQDSGPLNGDVRSIPGYGALEQSIRLAAEARTALDAALTDSAPSVRARARKLTTEK